MSIVDITEKPEIFREAVSSGRVVLQKRTVQLIREGKIEKGDPFYVAKIAGVQAAKKTSFLIPLCHNIALTSVKVEINIIDDNTVQAKSTVKTKAKTGVEMEALLATTTALLTILDMTKQYEKNFEGQYPHTYFHSIKVISKTKEQ
jgi:cyclic pyranopterin phosphate synthase